MRKILLVLGFITAVPIVIICIVISILFLAIQRNPYSLTSTGAASNGALYASLPTLQNIPEADIGQTDAAVEMVRPISASEIFWCVS